MKNLLIYKVVFYICFLIACAGFMFGIYATSCAPFSYEAMFVAHVTGCQQALGPNHPELITPCINKGQKFIQSLHYINEEK